MSRNIISFIVISVFLLICAMIISILVSQEAAAATKSNPPSPKPLTITRTVPQTLLPPATPDRARADGGYVQLGSEVDVALYCFALSGQEPQQSDYEQLAGRLSYEYRSAANPFEKQKILDTLKAQMQEKLRIYKNNRYFAITQPFYLDSYNIEKRAFPLVATQGVPVTWLNEGRLMYFLGSHSYILNISNAGDFARYKVEDEATAQRLEAQSPLQRKGQGTVYLFAEDVNPGAHTLRAQVVKTQLYANDKKLLSELESPNKS